MAFGRSGFNLGKSLGNTCSYTSPEPSSAIQGWVGEDDQDRTKILAACLARANVYKQCLACRLKLVWTTKITHFFCPDYPL